MKWIVSLLTPLVWFAGDVQAQNLPMLRSWGVPDYSAPSRGMLMSGIAAVKFTFDKEGTVTKTTLDSNEEVFGPEAERFVRSWRFEPGNGTPGVTYRTVINYEIDKEQNNLPEVRVAFNTWRYVKVIGKIVGVTRSQCPIEEKIEIPGETRKGDFVELESGLEPVYTTRVTEDGNVTRSWDRAFSVDIGAGKERWRIPQIDAHNLLERFRQKEFWSFCGQYDINITDSAGKILKVRVGGKRRSILNEVECGPQRLSYFEDAIEEIVQNHLWAIRRPEIDSILGIVYDHELGKPGVTPLMRAAAHEEIYDMEELIESNADLNQADSSGWTALMHAAVGWSGEAERLLLEKSADPNRTNARGETALMAAAMVPDWDQDLVKAGAQVNAQNKDGQTALMLMVGQNFVPYSSVAPMVKHALADGADATLKDRLGRTALDYLKMRSCSYYPDLEFAFDTHESKNTGKCSAMHPYNFDSDDLRETARLLEVAMQGHQH